jgi:hypothetical protein
MANLLRKLSRAMKADDDPFLYRGEHECCIVISPNSHVSGVFFVDIRFAEEQDDAYHRRPSSVTAYTLAVLRITKWRCIWQQKWIPYFHQPKGQEIPMKGLTSSRLPTAALLAYIDAALFALRFVFFAIPYLRFIPCGVSGLVQDGTILGALLGNAEHLLLFPIIAALPAPRWAKSAGYGWLVVDMATDIMALQGVSPTIYLPLRYGGHIAAALWAASAALQAKGAVRIVGVLYALDLALYSYLPHGVFFILLPSAVLLPLWLVLLGRLLAREHSDQSAGASTVEQSATA